MANAPHPDAASDTTVAHAMMPEPFGGDLEQYLVYSRVDILANLRVLIDRHVLVTVYFNQGTSFVVTRFLGINPEFEELIFDLAPDIRTNEKLQASDGLMIVAFLDNIKVQFAVNRAELTMFQGTPAFRVRTPRSILRLQRRGAFRARTQLTQSPYVVLSPTLDKLGKCDTARLRIADISATGFASVGPLGRPILTAGMRLAGCLLELKTADTFDIDIEVRHIAVFKDGFGREMCRAGCRFLRISGPAEMAVQRYVNQCAVAGRDNSDRILAKS